MDRGPENQRLSRRTKTEKKFRFLLAGGVGVSDSRSVMNETNNRIVRFFDARGREVRPRGNQAPRGWAHAQTAGGFVDPSTHMVEAVEQTDDTGETRWTEWVARPISDTAPESAPAATGDAPVHTPVHAAFVVAPAGVRGNWAATTRPGSSAIGLPGGKVEPGETPVEAAVREAAEEGWEIRGIDPRPIHAQNVDGRPVVWFRAERAYQRNEWPEQGRVEPVEATDYRIARSGFGNENVPVFSVEFSADERAELGRGMHWDRTWDAIHNEFGGDVQAWRAAQRERAAEFARRAREQAAANEVARRARREVEASAERDRVARWDNRGIPASRIREWFRPIQDRFPPAVRHIAQASAGAIVWERTDVVPDVRIRGVVDGDRFSVVVTIGGTTRSEIMSRIVEAVRGARTYADAGWSAY